MNIDARVVNHPRRLVVSFAWELRDMIQTENGNHPQLLHRQYNIEKPSRLVRFATRLQLTKEDKPMMNAVVQAYAFVSANYRQGDQVTLFVESYNDRYLDAAELLAHHLHDGTRPGAHSRVQSKNREDVPLGRIPVHCVAVSSSCVPISSLDKSGVSEWNDELKPRFPPGIEHIICWGYEKGSRSCATRCDVDRSIISREICISGDGGYELLKHCTKHAIYYEKDQISKWEDHEPVWTHKLDSSPSDVHGGLPLDTTKPFGMYVHELRKYEGLPGLDGDGSMLVWKSYRSANEHA